MSPPTRTAIPRGKGRCPSGGANLMPDLPSASEFGIEHDRMECGTPAGNAVRSKLGQVATSGLTPLSRWRGSRSEQDMSRSAALPRQRSKLGKYSSNPVPPLNLLPSLNSALDAASSIAQRWSWLTGSPMRTRPPWPPTRSPKKAALAILIPRLRPERATLTSQSCPSRLTPFPPVHVR